MMENMGYRQKEWLKGIVEKEAEEEERAASKEEEEDAKEQHDDDDEQYDTIAKITLV